MINSEERPLFIDGFLWPSEEHYVQAKRLTSLRDIEKVRKASTIHRAQQLGSRSHKPPRDSSRIRARYSLITQYPKLFKEFSLGKSNIDKEVISMIKEEEINQKTVIFINFNDEYIRLNLKLNNIKSLYFKTIRESITSIISELSPSCIITSEKSIEFIKERLERFSLNLPIISKSSPLLLNKILSICEYPEKNIVVISDSPYVFHELCRSMNETNQTIIWHKTVLEAIFFIKNCYLIIIDYNLIEKLLKSDLIPRNIKIIIFSPFQEIIKNYDIVRTIDELIEKTGKFTEIPLFVKHPTGTIIWLNHSKPLKFPFAPSIKIKHFIDPIESIKYIEEHQRCFLVISEDIMNTTNLNYGPNCFVYDFTTKVDEVIWAINEWIY